MQAKLIVFGAGASILALSIVAVVAFFITKDAISDSVINGLSAVATTQRQQINSMFANYEEDLDSVANDTQVRQSLRHIIATNDHVDRFVLNQTLTDRATVEKTGESFDIQDTFGQILASSEPGHIGKSPYDPTEEGFVIKTGTSDENGSESEIRLSAPITFDGRIIGYVTLHHDFSDLDQIVTRYIGRRDTGETLVVTRNSDGELHFVTPLRFNEGGDFYRPIDTTDSNRLEVRSMSTVSMIETDLVDYRGKRVFGVHHYIEAADIGLVVKIDEAEALSRLDSLGRGLVLTILLVSIVIGLFAIFVARHLIEPITQLTQAADRFSRGELGTRIAVVSTDEIGTLSHTFNNMAGSIQSANTELESRVDERTSDLRRSNQDLEQFAYVASHDLQEPLRMVSSYTQLLSRRYTGKLDHDADEFIGFAVDGAKRMQTLINDLLTYSRAGRSDGQYSEYDARDIVDEAVGNLESRIESSDAELRIGNLPTLVADHQQLVSIFQNLISNSIKYRSASRTPIIEVSSERVGNAWRFAVRDNGIGIDPAFTDRIFTIFQRLHGREEYQGTGIGLAVVKKLIERTGGSIWVESEPDEGSTFFFTVIDRQSDTDVGETNERTNFRAAS
ncbi:ATP-binding protein [Candidatus Lucifugimonas marina]|uniref:histidine kinase n=2 Tax=Candidatus Lucifugimonas marina TaxID=3038979 RepID=A0AAJ6CRQ4_9CHLR|nr:HAMP domain-containing protein [SAR202 cluster bacterium JH702]MDG0868895.1 HAMP domain-containing protein [SAR202 cluster bacterium JH639]WFG35524.1 HAMP domain-containing protein [SAR202 cluster bacterium JH545]WFG39471.1 HAMP domain-containing protein [SAR202 cluster bacterium JH1073]